MSAAKVGTEIRQEFNKQLAALSARQETVRQKFQVVRQASGETWEESKIRLESAMTLLHQDLNRLKELVGKTSGESLGWVQGMTSKREVDSEGWVEGQGHKSEHSEGWAEGQGHQTEDSEGWAEGMTEPASPSTKA
jgi:hypothetical protein